MRKKIPISVAAEKLAVSTRTVYRLMDARELEWTYHGLTKGKMVYIDSLDLFVKRREQMSIKRCLF